MKEFLYLSAGVALLAGCSGSKVPDAPVLYRNAQYNLTFSLTTDWSGYSVLTQRWEGQAYLPAVDQSAVIESGPVIVLRHPRWSAGKRYQDIPVLVFTRNQWEAHDQGRFSIGAGGIEEEIAHNREYVFAISSRFNANDSVEGWKEASDVVARNQAANAPALHPH